RFLRSISEKNVALQPYLTPIIILLAIFAFSTWIIEPLSNLLFRLNKFGRHLLSEEEIKSSNFVGISIIILLVGLVTILVDVNYGAALSVFGFSMIIPLSRLFDKPSSFFLTYGIGMVIIGSLALITVFYTGNLFNTFSVIYIVSFVAFQWLANYFSIKSE
ncbi:MAG: hypothetical protein Q8K02_17715, partial [Flavobacterium sp.]|nr:hypothetical protein [Flavobacterium sp.]